MTPSAIRTTLWLITAALAITIIMALVG